MPGALVPLAERLQGVCLGRGITVAVAESCTGGLVAATITEVAGSSGYFLGGVVSYSNAAKESLLDVPGHVLAAHGAVSAQVARAMAGRRAGAVRARRSARRSRGSPAPTAGARRSRWGSRTSPLRIAGGTDVRRFTFGGDRAANRDAAARAVLEWLLERAEAGAA